MWPTPNAMDGSRPLETPTQWRERQRRKKAQNPNLGGLHRPLTVAILEDEPATDVPLVSRQLTFSAEDFPVSPTASLASAAAPPMIATYGANFPDSFAKLDPGGSWLKMCRGFYQPNLDGSLDEYSETWPRAGMTRSGTAFLLPPLAPLTDVTGSGSWPTPQTTDAESACMTEKRLTRPKGVQLRETVQMWPTPTSRDHKDGSAQSCANVPVNALLGRAVHEYSDQQQDLAPSGSLNPQWVEWLMGYPSGWTDLEG